MNPRHDIPKDEKYALIELNGLKVTRSNSITEIRRLAGHYFAHNIECILLVRTNLGTYIQTELQQL